jgi:PAS domain S-box-containing protein
MNDNVKTQSELISDLKALQKEYDVMKERYEKEISQLKMAEEAMISEHLLMDAIMNNFPDHIYFKDLNSRFIGLNSSLAHFLGLKTPEEGVGKTDFDYFTKEHAQQAFDDEQTIIHTGQLLTKEEKETHHDNADTWVSTIKLPLHDKKGSIIGTFGISRDITKRKMAEKELSEEQYLMRTLMDNLPDHIYFKDNANRFLRINKAMAEFLGFNDSDKAIGKSDFDFFTEEHARQAFEDEQKVKC